MDDNKKLIQTLSRHHSPQWITQYFNLLKKLLEELSVDSDDPRLAMTLKTAGLPVNLGQRYILKPYPRERLGIIVPETFAEETVNGGINFLFSLAGVVDAKWIIVDYPMGQTVPPHLYNACVEACTDILKRCKRSGFRRHHVPLLYEVTTELAVREEILREVIWAKV